MAIADRFPDVYCSIGTHPHHAHEELDLTTAALVALTRHPKTVAIGEAGSAEQRLVRRHGEGALAQPRDGIGEDGPARSGGEPVDRRG